MIYKLAELLRDEISGLDIVEIAAGLAKPKIVRNNATPADADTPEMVDITIPMAYNDLGITCEEGDLYGLMPNTKKKSIHWFEDNGVELVSEDTYYYHSRASLTLVSWWNMPLINASLQTPDLLVAALIAAMPTKLTTTGYMSMIRVAFEGQEPNLDAILGRYTFNFAEDQINTYPYALTGLRFSVDFAFGKNCTEAVIIDPSVCAPAMKAEAQDLITINYTGTQVQIFYGIETDYSIVIDWGNGTSEEKLTSGNDTSTYTTNGSKSVKIRGALNMTSISIPSGAPAGGQIGWFAEYLNITTLTLIDGSYTGDISQLVVLTGLTDLQIDNTLAAMNITGSIAGFSVMTGLIDLVLHNHIGITGNIESFVTLTALLNLDLTDTSVTGDVALIFPSFTGILAGLGVYLTGTNVDYTNATLPTWDGIDFFMDDIGLSNAELDSILSDLATSVITNSTIVLDGTNGAPTDDVDWDALIALGNTVAVNTIGLNAGGGSDTDWLFRQGADNLPQLWTGTTNITFTRVTGNGFAGYAQRTYFDTVQSNGGLIILTDADGNDIFTVGNNYTVSVMYRKKIGSEDIIVNDAGAGRPIITAVDNEGVAAVVTTNIFTPTLTFLRIYMYNAVPGSIAIGDWFEIDEIAVTPSTFCAEYAAVYNAYTTKPDAAVAAIWNTFVETLVASGEWAKLDVLYVYAAHTNGAGEALINWKNPGTFDATAFNAPIHTANEGFEGNGTTQYINNNWNALTDGVNYTQDNASIGCYIRTNNVASGTKVEIGMGDGVTMISFIMARFTGDVARCINNCVTPSTGAVVNSQGLYIANRLDATDNDVYKNKVKISDLSTASTAIVSTDMYSLAWSNSGVPANHSDRQNSMAFAGSGFAQTNVNNFTDAFEVAMDALGTGVIP